jgi:hypothetical protein
MCLFTCEDDVLDISRFFLKPKRLKKCIQFFFHASVKTFLLFRASEIIRHYCTSLCLLNKLFHFNVIKPLVVLNATSTIQLAIHPTASKGHPNSCCGYRGPLCLHFCHQRWSSSAVLKKAVKQHCDPQFYMMNFRIPQNKRNLSV